MNVTRALAEAKEIQIANARCIELAEKIIEDAEGDPIEVAISRNVLIGLKSILPLLWSVFHCGEIIVAKLECEVKNERP